MTWSTKDEIRFINGLGSHANPKRVIPPEEKLEYLKRYRRGIELRRVWTGINSTEVKQYTDQRIAYYEALVAQKEN